MKKDLLTIMDLTREEIIGILDRAKVLKKELKAGMPHKTLAGKTMVMIFKKHSTRTRVSFQTGFFQMGGLAIDLNQESLQLGRGETISDTARVLSRYADLLLIRTFEHAEVEAFARFAQVPVINGLTDSFHPCQILSDLLTIEEYLQRVDRFRIAYVGDCNNVANSWMNAAGVMGFDLMLASPQGFTPDMNILEEAKGLAAQKGCSVEVFERAEDAVSDADIIYTDVWISMGQEEGAEEKRKRFADFQVNSTLVKNAAPDVLVMHCLPAHRGEEITAEVLECPNSVVFDQAENRLHVQKAIMECLIFNHTIKR